MPDASPDTLRHMFHKPGAMSLLRILALLIASIAPQWTTAAEGPKASPSPQPSDLRILILGDSLTEGYGVPLHQAYPALLQEHLRASFPKIGEHLQVINAGIGGSTSASGMARLRWHLRAKPQLLVLALGANDMLRGLPAKATEQNLRATLQLARDESIPMILAGIRVPPNYGKKYQHEFEAIFPRLAREFRIPFIPFLLEGVAGVRELNQEDGIHPNERGQARIVQTVAPEIERFLQKREAP